MSMIDPLNEIHQQLSVQRENEKTDDNLGWTLTGVDKKHIIPTTALILRRGAPTHRAIVCHIMFTHQTRQVLPASLLGAHTYKAGEYLLERYACQANLFGRLPTDQPELVNVPATPYLLAKLQRCKSTTIQRSIRPTKTQQKTEKELKEEMKQTNLTKELKQMECFSSEMNTCQSVVKTDCSKPKVQKAAGIHKALTNLLLRELQDSDLHTLVQSGVALHRSSSTINLKIIAAEFTRMKFKTTANSGSEYMSQTHSYIIQPLLNQCPSLERIVICEEKHSFTPDDFTAATRKQRQNTSSNISHLKVGTDMITGNKLDKVAITSTSEGKMIISNYLAENVDKLSIEADITTDIDSELHTECDCHEEATSACVRNKYSVPITCSFQWRSG